jgi:hypothetical protein
MVPAATSDPRQRLTRSKDLPDCGGARLVTWPEATSTSLANDESRYFLKQIKSNHDIPAKTRQDMLGATHR